MTLVRRFFALLTISALCLFGTPANAAGPAAAPQAVVVNGSVWGPWVTYEGPFKTNASCQNRSRVVYDKYKGNHYGAVKDTRCVYAWSNTCPQVKQIWLQVRYEVGSNLPTSVTPLSAAPRAKTTTGAPVSLLCG